MTFEEAMNRYGSDKPDTRFDMLIEDITDWACKTDFAVFKNAIEAGGVVKAIVAKNAAGTYSRKKIDKLTDAAKGIGAKGLAYVRWADEVPNCSFGKFLAAGQLEELLSALGAEKATAYSSSAIKKRLRFPFWEHCALSLPKSLI